METMNPSDLVNLYQTGFYCCLALTIVSAAFAVFVFFKNDIRTLFEKKTGMARRQTAREMQQKNEMTDQLMNAGVNLDFGKTGETEAEASQEALMKRKESSGSLRRQSSGSLRKQSIGTTGKQGLFKRKPRTGEISSVSSVGDVVVSAGMSGNVPAGQIPKKSIGKERVQQDTVVLQNDNRGFVINERILVIHTSELIEV